LASLCMPMSLATVDALVTLLTAKRPRSSTNSARYKARGREPASRQASSTNGGIDNLVPKLGRMVGGVFFVFPGCRPPALPPVFARASARPPLVGEGYRADRFAKTTCTLIGLHDRFRLTAMAYINQPWFKPRDRSTGHDATGAGAQPNRRYESDPAAPQKIPVTPVEVDGVKNLVSTPWRGPSG